VTAEEVAALALLLASEEGRGINGQAINVEWRDGAFLVSSELLAVSSLCRATAKRHQRELLAKAKLH